MSSYGFPKLNFEWRSHWPILTGMPSNGSSLPTALITMNEARRIASNIAKLPNYQVER